MLEGCAINESSYGKSITLALFVLIILKNINNGVPVSNSNRESSLLEYSNSYYLCSRGRSQDILTEALV